MKFRNFFRNFFLSVFAVILVKTRVKSSYFLRELSNGTSYIAIRLHPGVVARASPSEPPRQSLATIKYIYCHEHRVYYVYSLL